MVDCYNDGEQLTGLYTMIEDNVVMPFTTLVLGVKVTVQEVDLVDDDRIVAICRRGDLRQAIGILDLPLPDPPPDGVEWIEAYRHWAQGQVKGGCVSAFAGQPRESGGRSSARTCRSPCTRRPSAATTARAPRRLLRRP